MGPTQCCCLPPALSTSQALDTPGPSQELGQALLQSRKKGSVPGLDIIPTVSFEEGVWPSWGSAADSWGPMAGSASKDQE